MRFASKWCEALFLVWGTHMNNSLVSVVMPVYNTGEILKKSIDCILNQTYTNIELICVDDASDDVITKEILEERKKKDARVKLIVLDKNIGAGGARNIGLREANGEYILFFDSDDLASPVMIEKLYSQSRVYQLDMCICSAVVIDDDTEGYIGAVIPREIVGITDNVFTLDKLGIDGLTYWNPAPWNKLFRTEFIKENKVEFQEISSCNDVYFTTMCALLAKRIMYCHQGQPLVRYRAGRKNQITNKKNVTNLVVAYEEIFRSISSFTELAKEQVLVNLVHLAESELKYGSNNSGKEVLYQVVNKRIKEYNANTLKKSSKYKIIQSFINEPFSDKWIEKENKIHVSIENIINKLSKDEPIIIWGYGKNGTDIDRILYEEGNEIDVFVVDNKNIMIGEKTRFGSKIINTEDALSSDKYIVATNKEIKDYLLSNGVKKDRLMIGYTDK